MKSLKKLALVVLTLAVLLTCFASCEQIEKIPGLENILDMLPGAEDEHVHAFGEATCTAPATCECGATEGDPLSHSFADGKCACGAEDPNYVPPHTHTFVDGVCECGESDPDYVPPHTHNFVDGVCECGEADPDYVPPHEHTFVDGVCECGEYDHEHECEENIFYHPELEAATCTTPGVAVFECIYCDYYYTEETPVDPEAHGFWGEREVLTEANCQTKTNGLEKVFCANGCGSFEEVEVSYYEVHNWDVQKQTYATCTSDGEYYAVCTLCDEVESYVYYSEGHYNWYLTCGESGTCMECGVEFTLEHNTVSNPATCTEPAFCMNCWSEVGEPLGHSYVEGKCTVCGAEDPDYIPPVPPFGGGSADFGTIVLPSSKPTGDSSYTATYTTTNGWVTNYSAIQCGGTTDMNPQFTVIGPDTTYKAVCLNGKTSAPGKITSPVLVDGLSKLTVNFTKIFTDTELSVTVTVTELSTGNVYTYVIARSLDKNEKYQVYTEVWTLDVPVTGEFTIEIVNNCPTNQNSNKDRMTILSIVWEGAAPAHEHEYTMTTTATCTAAGVNTYTCACGDTYTEECDVLDHVDRNLDITCDFEGCSKRILPAADSTISLFTANHMIIISLTNSYYVEGTVTSVDDARNGKFIITDEAGDTILIYLPVDENGVTHANWVSKVLVGDVVRVYGKPVSTSGLNTTQKAAIKSGVLTFISKHPHAFGEPTCVLPGYCECGQDGPVALGHIDENANDLCDRCDWNLKLDIETVTTRYNDVKNTDKADTTNGVVTFDGVNFTATFTKGSAALNTNGTDHMRLNKGNVLTVTSNNGKNIVGITLVASSSSYVDELELYCQALGYEYTVDGNEITFTVEACTVLELANSSSKAQRIASVKVIYEK